MNDKIMIAMSGGVDSAVAAALCAKSHPAAGVTMQHFAACGEKDATDAAALCAMLGIPHFIAHLEKEFEKDVVLPVRTYAEIEAAFAAGKHAALLTVEGGLGFNTVENFRAVWEAGVRVFGVTWLSNDMAKSNRDNGENDTGLSDLGRAIVAEGNRLGMIFDVSHISDKSFWDLAEIAEKPIIATHSNFRTLCGHTRNLTDDMARQIVKGDGMIGLNLCTGFVHDDPEQQTIGNFFRHLDYCLENFGEDHIGFGGDIDGMGGEYPKPVNEGSSIHDQLIDFMEKHYSVSVIEKVSGTNYLNFLKKYL